MQFAEPTSGESAERFTKVEAENTGKNEATIIRAAARGEALGFETLNRIVGTSLDKGVEIDALKKMDEPEREALIERATAVRR
jgi:hypothetical protein